MPASASSASHAAVFNETVPPATAKREATEMVPAEAILAQEIDAKKMQPGEQFHAKLSDNVQLKDGVELPKGTELIGKVAKDNMENDGTSTLALNFTTAHLKNGKAIPIDATIMGIAPPEYGAAWDGGVTQAAPGRWNGQVLQLDQVRALSGVDLHSRIAGQESGVFISNSKDNVKLSNQSQLSLAIAGRESGNGMNGGA
jgi:hypothetical protein